MTPVLECVPNFSEGCDEKTIQAIVQSAGSVSGAYVLHVDSGIAANRTVVTFAGAPEAVVEAAFRAVRTAAERIDMRHQHGEHPRIGATDVLPLVPVRGIDLETAARLAPEERVRYDLGRLGSGSYNRFRVAALDGDGTELQAEEVSFWASVSPLYGTIWPIQSLTLYEDPGKGTRLASVPGGTALCVLAEEGDWFRVRYGEEYGWVDSRFCMINLPEYVGDHCSYDITNSYDSLFAVHGVSIREVTHQVLPGYEDVRTADGAFLVPYLYPCAKKLLTAAQAADLLLLTLDRYAGKMPLLMGVRKAGFHRRVLPGDTLELHASLLEERPAVAVPAPAVPDVDLDALIAENQKLKAELTARREEQEKTYVPKPLDLTEYETRKLYIDAMLLDAGWTQGQDWLNEVELSGMPNKSGVGYADYVLYSSDGRPLAVIEAKRTCVDVSKGRQQAKLYANILEEKYGRRPVVFLTNGFDTRIWNAPYYNERPVSGVYAKRDLEKEFNKLAIRAPLENVSPREDIAGRYGMGVNTVKTSLFRTRQKLKAYLEKEGIAV